MMEVEMEKRILIAVLVWFSLAGVSWAQNYGQSDGTPATYVATNGKIQVRYNIKAVIATDPDGTTHAAYSYDYATVDKLEKADVDKALSPAAADSIKAAPLVVSKELVVGYNGPDKASYDAKFNTIKTDPIVEAPVDKEPLEKP